MIGYVIESNTHGVFTDYDWSTTGNSYGPRFSYSIKRSEGQVFASIDLARKELSTIQNYKHYAWKKQSWINRLVIIDLLSGKEGC